MLLPIPKWNQRTRLAFGILLALLLVSESTALAFYSLRIGHGNESSYYRGTPEDAEIDLDEGLFYPKSLVELLEVAHPHSFGFVMFFALLAFLATAFPLSDRKIKVWTIGFGGSIIAFMAVPFVIRFVWAGASGGYGVFGAIMSIHVYAFIGAGIWSLRQSSETQP